MGVVQPQPNLVGLSSAICTPHPQAGNVAQVTPCRLIDQHSEDPASEVLHARSPFSTHPWPISQEAWLASS